MTLTAGNINDLFEVLEIIFPASGNIFTDPDKLQKMKKMWFNTFCDENFTNESLKLGIKRAQKANTNFFPSIGVFIDWCKPKANDLNIPPVDVAYQEAARNSRSDGKSIIWSHEIVEYSAKRTGYHQLSTQPEKISFATFIKHYEEAAKDLIAGKPLSNFKTNRLVSHNNDKNGIDLWEKIRYYTPDTDGIRPCDKKI